MPARTHTRPSQDISFLIFFHSFFLVEARTSDPSNAGGCPSRKAVVSGVRQEKARPVTPITGPAGEPAPPNALGGVGPAPPHLGSAPGAEHYAPELPGQPQDHHGPHQGPQGQGPQEDVRSWCGSPLCTLPTAPTGTNQPLLLWFFPLRSTTHSDFFPCCPRIGIGKTPPVCALPMFHIGHQTRQGPRV